MSDQISSAGSQSGLTDNTAGALAYVTIIPAIIFLVLEPYNKSSFVRFHAWQSIFFGIAFVAAHIILGFVPIIGWMALAVLDVLFLIVWVMAILKASKGERWHLPVIGAIADKQAGA